MSGILKPRERDYVVDVKCDLCGTVAPLDSLDYAAFDTDDTGGWADVNLKLKERGWVIVTARNHVGALMPNHPRNKRHVCSTCVSDIQSCVCPAGI